MNNCKTSQIRKQKIVDCVCDEQKQTNETTARTQRGHFLHFWTVLFILSFLNFSDNAVQHEEVTINSFYGYFKERNNKMKKKKFKEGIQFFA